MPMVARVVSMAVVQLDRSMEDLEAALVMFGGALDRYTSDQ